MSRERDYDADGRDGWEEDGTDDASKPRRLEASTATYLLQLERQFSTLLEERNASNDAEEEDDTVGVFISNVLAEIKTSTASAACDRRTNYIIEKLCYNSSLSNVMELFVRFTSYSVFLARNRHSSHILQALMARFAHLMKTQDIPEDLDEETISATILQFVRPILKDMSWLMKEQGASHVIRSTICILSGLPVIAEKKGKNSKHVHSSEYTTPLQNLIVKEKFYLNHEHAFSVPQDFYEALGVAVVSLCALPIHELHQLVADMSSCVTLCLVFRVLSNPDLVEGGPTLCDQLMRTLLGWKESSSSDKKHKDNEGSTEDDDNTEAAASVVYGMAGDKAGSYFLETVIEVCPHSLLVQMVKHAVVGRAKEYAMDSFANYVLQVVLKRLRIAQTIAENIDISSISKALLKELSGKTIMRELLREKGGVVLHMLELASYASSKKKNLEEKLIHRIIKIWSSEVVNDKKRKERGEEKDNSDDEEEAEVDVETIRSILALKLGRLTITSTNTSSGKNTSTSKGKQPMKYHESESQSSMVGGANISDPTQHLNAKLIAHILHSPLRSLSLIFVQAIASLPRDILMNICLSGPLSRPLLTEGMFAVVQASSANPNIDIISSFLSSFDESQLMSLANHYVGQHVFRQLYLTANASNREVLVQMVDNQRTMLNGTKEGRNAIKVSNADLFRRNKNDWRSMNHRQSRANDMMSELTNSISPIKSHSSTEHSTGYSKNNTSYNSSSYNQSKSYGNSNNNGNYNKSSYKHSSSSSPSSVPRYDNSDKKGRKRRIERKGKEGGADFEKIAKLKTSKLNLNLAEEVSRMQKERERR